MKGPDVEAEAAEATRAFVRLGGGAPSIREFTLPRAGVGRSLVLVPKSGVTPDAYPRGPGTARKKPL
jgi:16S rRNA (guanine527-N7)-methyltransferase